MRVPFKQVDVFSATPYRGNALAVVLDAANLSDVQMQQIARWTNLSETTFVHPVAKPEADYHVRIFTPRAELAFAGHPTLGTAHALIESGRVTPRNGRVVQQCGAGLVEVRASSSKGENLLQLVAPSATFTPLNAEQRSVLGRCLSTRIAGDAQVEAVNVGPVWTVMQIGSAAELLALEPDLQQLEELDEQLGATGLTLFAAHPAGHEAAIEVRSFAPRHGIAEDPVCGSGNAAVASLIRRHGLVAQFGRRYTASQGTRLKRQGRVDVEFADRGEILIGGACVTCIDGEIRFPDR